jgi:hypothetical protein
MPRITLALLPPLLGLAAACSDANSLPDPTDANVVDTVTIGALVGTPIATPSAWSITAGTVRTDLSSEFEFAYNVEADGRRVLLPRAAMGLVSNTGLDPGLQLRTESFDAITKARSNGYTTDAPVPVETGHVFLVRSRLLCTSLGVPLYGKIQILSFEDSTVTFQVLADRNCGYKGLKPGLPDE